ncbi:MAG: kelch repeat-containing protein [Acidobacteriota bacterium]
MSSVPVSCADLSSRSLSALIPTRRVSSRIASATWTSAGSLHESRQGCTTTLLPNGQFLVVGGVAAGSTGILKTVELYNPASNGWSYTGNLIEGRYGHTATLLPNGKVLVVGGEVGADQLTNGAELYDPATGTWSGTAAAAITARIGHLATLLANGRVLVVGGFGGLLLNSAEIYDPATEEWSSIANLNSAHYPHTATLLADGKVLVVGLTAGKPTSSAELYDPATGTWSVTSSLNMVYSSHTATRLPDGKVLVAWADSTAPHRAEISNPTSGTWSNTGAPSVGGSAILLPNGNVLAPSASSTELYDPATGMWVSTAGLYTSRFFYTATLLANDKVLAMLGTNFNPNSAELFDLGPPESGTLASVSAASFSSMRMASEGIAASFGTGLATASIGATTLPLPTSLAGTTVKVTDSAGTERLAPLFFVSPTQVNYQIPSKTVAGLATLTITSGDGTVSTGVAIVRAVAPSLFTANANGPGVAAAVALRVKADGSQNYESIAQYDAQNKFISRPLDLGPETDQVYLILFGTGIRHRSSLSAVITTIGGTYAESSFAGPQGDFVGLDQVNVLLPRSLIGRGEMDVLLTVEAQMANPVRLSIK